MTPSFDRQSKGDGEADQSTPAPQVGQIVQITKGRDRGRFAVIIRILDHRFLLVADGDKRTFDRCKRKNIGHVKLFSYVSHEVKRSMEETGRVTNAKIRFAIADFFKHEPEIRMEGE